MRMRTAYAGARPSCSKWAWRLWSSHPANWCVSRQSTGSVCVRIAWSPYPKLPRRGLRQLRRAFLLDRPYFLFVGTIEPRKNLATLLDAWREVRREHEVDLFIAGRRRADAPPIAPEPGLQLLGEVPDEQLPALYSGALAFVYPSLYEGFGLPVLEAMQCGAPVIASRAVAEVAGDAAIYADTALELAQAMRDVALHADRLPEWRERSLARAREFTWDRAARDTYEVYPEARKRFGR